MIDDDEAVPICGANGCTRPAGAGATICARDTDRLGQWLAQLGTEYERLSAAPSMQGREPGTGGGGGLASERSVGSLGVMVLRDRRSRERDAEDADGNGGRGVEEVLFARAAEVREGRQLVRERRRLPAVRVAGGAEGPVCADWCDHDTCRDGTMRATALVPLTVLSERKLLSDHLEWILTQEWAGEFFDEIRALWGLLRAANGHSSGARRVRCREDGCTGSVRWVDGAAVCGACGKTTRGPELLRVAAEEAA